MKVLGKMYSCACKSNKQDLIATLLERTGSFYDTVETMRSQSEIPEESLLFILQNIFGIPEFRPNQLSIIQSLLTHHSCVLFPSSLHVGVYLTNGKREIADLSASSASFPRDFAGNLATHFAHARSRTSAPPDSILPRAHRLSLPSNSLRIHQSHQFRHHQNHLHLPRKTLLLHVSRASPLHLPCRSNRSRGRRRGALHQQLEFQLSIGLSSTLLHDLLDQPVQKTGRLFPALLGAGTHRNRRNSREGSSGFDRIR